MTTLIEGREFQGRGQYRLADRADIELRRCTFSQFQAPAWSSVSERPTIRSVNLVRCHVTVSTLGPVVAEDCLIDTVWFHRGIWGPQAIAGCALKHVVIRGNITGGLRFLVSHAWHASWPRYAMGDDAFAKANAQFYASVDWALDISEARFTGIEMSWCDIPARLIRRDPETQVVVTRESVARGDWRSACGDSSLWVAIERFLETGFPDTVLVAPKRSKRFATDKLAIDRLCDAGMALR